jgi:hypothetical protein
MLHLLHTYVTSVCFECSAVSNVYCKCFIWMLHMLQCPYTYIASMCCKCFIYFGCPYTYIASMCCKYFIYFVCMLQQMLYVESVSWAGVARGRRWRWSPRAWSTKLYPWAWQQARSTKMHPWAGSRHGARCCIHGQIVGAEHETKRSTKLHLWTGSRCRTRGEAEHEAASIGA